MSEVFIPKTMINGKVVIWTYVEHLQSAVEWYSYILEMEPTERHDAAYFFTINEYTKLALCNRYMRNPTYQLPVNDCLDLQADDIFTTHEQLKEKGVLVGPVDNPFPTYYEFYFVDIENNKIRIHGFA